MNTKDPLGRVGRNGKKVNRNENLELMYIVKV